MDTNTISNSCSAGGDLGSGRTDYDSAGFGGGEVPEPGTMALLGFGVSLILLGRRQPQRRKR